MAESKKVVLKKGEKIINLKDKVTVIATKDAKHHKAGKEVTCHPEVAKFMIKNGWATEKKGGNKDAAKSEE